MSKTRAIETMNSTQIKARLAELDHLDAAHEARDMDAELSAAYLSGDNVEALANLQLEAEKSARLLRVERISLTGALPEAIKREAQPVIDAKAEQHAKLAAQATDIAQQILDDWQALSLLIEQWNGQRQQSITLSVEAAETAIKAGLPTPRQFGAFVDGQLTKTGSDMKTTGHRLAWAAQLDIPQGSHELTH